LPVPRPGQVLGLVGTNGIGKSTALKVLAGKLKPNLGRFKVYFNICSIPNFIFQFVDSILMYFFLEEVSFLFPLK
jgi:translation initiation factor RLI1